MSGWNNIRKVCILKNRIPYKESGSGITSAAIKYTTSPVPQPANEQNIHMILMIVGSILRYSPMPPHTPHIVLLVAERVNFL